MAADRPGDRRKLLVRRIVESRRTGDPAVFDTGGASVEYDDRGLRLEADPDERDRLGSLLSAYHVFKIKQPETRKAADGVLYVSAVTDPKHAADFIEAVFRDVYGLGERYELRESTRGTD
ncbi:hypothetical protein [Natronomonas sp. LN261]|uniref:hypothetical protein n=1 Tax=Natronomonas sp. LN261 TaxID=2750669 RepID=UPI0015EFBACE|nr:hypothetical protein [Natronomonas sp. LN261]